MAAIDEEKVVEVPEEKEEKMADGEEKEAEKKEESEEESSDEEPAPGLFDKPVMIFDQRRDRKKVERLSIDSTAPKKTKLDYSKGKGIKLGDLEITNYELNQSTSSELKPLHRLLYKRDGKLTMIKKNLREFCGFPFETDSKEYASLEWSLEKFTNTGLQRLCEIFGMDQKGKRDELKEKVLKFVMEPYETGKTVPKSVKSKPKKRKTKASSDEKSQKKKSKKSSADSDDDGGDSDSDDDDDDHNDEEEETASPEAEEKKKSKPKKTKATVIKLPSLSKKRKSEEKAKTPKSSTPKKTQKKAAKKVADDSDDDDDEPLVKKVKPEPPSDAALEKIVRQLLDGADLETVTMKIICKQVFNKFPGQDLSERKPFIKETVKKIVS